MSSFFTLPKSQKKRKRDEGASAKDQGKTKQRSTNSRSSKAPRRQKSDESISGSESDVAEQREAGVGDRISEDGDSASEEDETAAERRLRLAEQYLENIKSEVENRVGFDAEEIDRDLIAERLQEDVAESKGHIFKRIASNYDYDKALQTRFRMTAGSVTTVTACDPYVYTTTKDKLVIKWKLPSPLTSRDPRLSEQHRSSKPIRRRPERILTIGGPQARKPKLKSAEDSAKQEQPVQRHSKPILAAALSENGKYLATGSSYTGMNNSSKQRRQVGQMIVYDTATLTPLRIFSGRGPHRDAITALAFLPGSQQLFSAARDRTVKVWPVDGDSVSYVETLFGHQDEVVDIAGYPGNVERCVSVGARDRTARIWKVAEETQLVFRGGGIHQPKRSSHTKALTNGDTSNALVNGPSNNHSIEATPPAFAEGSIDCIALLDIDTFITGSDNGSLCLWSVHKKKPIFTAPLAHGLSYQLKPHEASAERIPTSIPAPARQPCWITALACVSLSDLVVSGSWDGTVRVWRVGPAASTQTDTGTAETKKRSPMVIELVATLGHCVFEPHDGGELRSSVRGIVNSLAVFERETNPGAPKVPQKGKVKRHAKKKEKSLCVIAGFGTEHRLGRWHAGGIYGAPKSLRERGAVEPEGLDQVDAQGWREEKGDGDTKGRGKYEREGRNSAVMWEIPLKKSK